MDARRSALASRLDDRRGELSRLRRERGQAGRARAHLRRTDDLRHGRATRRYRPRPHRRLRRSLGTALATHVAARGRPRGSCWSRRSTTSRPSARSTIRGCRFRCCCGIASTRSPTAGGSRTPLLTLVAAADTIIPVARSRALYAAWAGPKHWQVVPGGTTIRSVRHRALGRRRAISGAALNERTRAGSSRASGVSTLGANHAAGRKPSIDR